METFKKRALQVLKGFGWFVTGLLAITVWSTFITVLGLVVTLFLPFYPPMHSKPGDLSVVAVIAFFVHSFLVPLSLLYIIRFRESLYKSICLIYAIGILVCFVEVAFQLLRIPQNVIGLGRDYYGYSFNSSPEIILLAVCYFAAILIVSIVKSHQKKKLEQAGFHLNEEQNSTF